MVRRARVALIAASATLAVVSAACGGSSGGSKPTIHSFTATPGTLPYGGGQVSFTWSVTGASRLDLEPGVGLVSGTGATVAVGSSSTWTLTATNSHGVVTAKTSINVATSMTVSGRVVSYGTPAGHVVHVLGQGTAPALTDTNGAFSIDGVVPPYDIAALYINGQTVAIVWRGLTRPDPTLESPNAIFLSAFDNGSVSGTVATAAGFPEAPGALTRIGLSGGHMIRNSTSADTTTSAWSSGDFWFGPSAISLHVHAIEGQGDPANPGRPTSFLRAGSTTATLANGAAVSGVDIPMSPISTGTITGVVTTAAGFAHPSVTEQVVFAPAGIGGPAFDVGDAVVVSGMQCTNGSFSLAAPVIPGTTITLTGFDFGPGGISEASHSGLPANSSSAALSFLPPPVIELPTAGAIVGPGTIFAWTGTPGAVSETMIVGPGYQVAVIGTANEMTVPDLGEVGVSMPANASMFWFPIEVGPFTSMDEATGPAGILAPPAAQSFVLEGNSQGFTSAP
ncbi:MAG TPA: hypothetical protein VMV18_13740 [bacterium]|nr:hypothetical protein [bacterium]